MKEPEINVGIVSAKDRDYIFIFVYLCIFK